MGDYYIPHKAFLIPAAPNPANYDITYQSYWWANDLSATGDGNTFQAWTDGGVNATDLVQATEAKRFTWHESVAAYNNRPAVKGNNAAGAFMQTGNWAGVLAQPWVTVLIANASGASRVLLDGNDGTNRGLFWIDGGGNREINNGITRQVPSHDTDPHIWQVIGNGASTQVLEDGAGVIGPIDAGSNGLDGLTLFSNNAGAASVANDGYVAFVMVLTALEWLTNPAVATLLTDMAAYYNITVV